MSKLTDVRTDGRTDPNYRKAPLLKSRGNVMYLKQKIKQNKKLNFLKKEYSILIENYNYVFKA